jgi:hypothetical protein
LKKLAITLSKQLAVLDNSAENITSKVTPYGMEISLDEKYRETQISFN